MNGEIPEESLAPALDVLDLEPVELSGDGAADLCIVRIENEADGWETRCAVASTPAQ